MSFWLCVIWARHLDFCLYQLTPECPDVLWPEDQIDHINRIRTDNRISNLREVSHKQNHQNRSKSSHNTSGHSGVSWYKQKSRWRAQITHNQKDIHLGLFTNLEDAIAARKAAEKLYWSDTQ
jgi:hypothetical protein